MTDNRPTPETDAAAEEVGMGHFMVDADFARKLERERAEAWACCDELVVDSNAITLAKTVMRLERERDEAREALRTLAEHGEKEIQKLIEERDSAREIYKILHSLYADEIVKNRKLEQERDEARNKMADALQEVD